MPIFKPWEIDSLSSRLKLDIDVYHQNPDALLVELIHSAAYRNTLGRSLYMHPSKVGSFSPTVLESFVGARYVSQGAAVVGLGIEHDQLVQLVRKMTFHQGAPPADTKKAKYSGGEARHDLKIPLVHAALVTEGVPLSSPDLLALSILNLVLGVGPFVKYGSNLATSKISKAALSATSLPVSASCFNVSYTDSGLFGVQLVSSAKDVRKVLAAVTGAMGQVTKAAITDADLQRAKKQVKALVHSHALDAETFLESVGVQALYAKDVVQLGAIDSAIDKVSADQLNQLAKKVINGKPTLAVVGDLTYAPYLDEVVPPRA